MDESRREGGDGKHLLEVVEYTDPYCTWCWGAEPILRKIKEVYGDQVKISFKMGGLVEDIRQFYDPLNQIGGERIFDQVAVHWEDASRRHGMPVDTRVFQDLRGEFRSTYPASIAYKAAEIQSQELGERFLRRMREAAAAERRAIHRQEVQVELAREVGLDTRIFIEDLENGRAEKAFHGDLKECRGYGITGFPTFYLRNARTGNGTFVTGYRSFEYFEGILNQLSDGTQKKAIRASEEEITRFVERWGRVATQEVATVFGLRKEDALDLLTRLKEKGLLRRTKVGNDYFWSTSKAKG